MATLYDGYRIEIWKQSRQGKYAKMTDWYWSVRGHGVAFNSGARSFSSRDDARLDAVRTIRARDPQ